MGEVPTATDHLTRCVNLVVSLRTRTKVGRALRQSKSDVNAAGRRHGILAAACGDDDELAAVHLVHGGSGVAGEGKSCFPKQLTGGLIECPELFVEVFCPDEQNPARGAVRTSLLFRAAVLL